jgi:hypothetical protein
MLTAYKTKKEKDNCKAKLDRQETEIRAHTFFG